MSRCSHCENEGHNVRTCPLSDIEKDVLARTPWLKDPDDRWHTKIVSDEEDWPGEPVSEREVSCNCEVWDEGETHYDFDGM